MQQRDLAMSLTQFFHVLNLDSTKHPALIFIPRWIKFQAKHQYFHAPNENIRLHKMLQADSKVMIGFSTLYL